MCRTQATRNVRSHDFVVIVCVLGFRRAPGKSFDVLKKLPVRYISSSRDVDSSFAFHVLLISAGNKIANLR